MLQYIEYLLRDAPLSNELALQRKAFLLDEDSPKVILNCILETELFVYIDKIVDYKLVPYLSHNSNFNIIEIDAKMSRYYPNISVTELKHIAQTHFNPIWRLSAYFCDFILKVHESAD